MTGLPFLLIILILLGEINQARSEQNNSQTSADIAPTSGRLKVETTENSFHSESSLVAPLPAHAAQKSPSQSSPSFRVKAGRDSPPVGPAEAAGRADYLLPDRDEKTPITPENSNLNLPADLEITSTDTGEKILLPAGTYRQILQIPMDSPLMQSADHTRRNQSLPVSVEREKSRYAEPEKKPVWVRYESLEKIKIGEAERRGGIDLPSHGPKELGPRLWYAKSETADMASSMFYFVFGGLGYSTANLLGWSAGNTREIPGNFEYRLIRR